MDGFKYVVCFLLSVLSSEAIFNVYPRFDINALKNKYYGDPLYLTPFVEQGRSKEGRAAALVSLPDVDVVSYSGFFTVNKTYNSNLFFWFFPAEKNDKEAPVVVWLQGGPGASSLYGLFTENGPISVNQQNNVERREHYWSRILNVIYIDNPVGTGFSFTDHEAGYAVDQVTVGNDLYQLIIQFFQLFPQYAKNEFFITGESYAGKYVPAFAHAVDENNKKQGCCCDSINLKGIAMGNGFSDPINMLDYGAYLYQLGLIDRNTRNVIDKKKAEIIKFFNEGRYEEATDGFNQLILSDQSSDRSIFSNYTDFSYYYNYLHNKDEEPHGDLGAYLNQDIVRKGIHVGNLTYNSGTKVELYLKKDIMKSVKPWIEDLLEKYRVLVYNGQLDIIVAYPLTVNYLNTLRWSGSEEYKAASRKIWYVGDELAGYVKRVNNFMEVLVRNAGHMVPADQPLWAVDLIKRFTFNLPF